MLLDGGNSGKLNKGHFGKQEMVVIVPPLRGRLFFPVGPARWENIIAMEIVEYIEFVLRNENEIFCFTVQEAFGRLEQKFLK